VDYVNISVGIIIADICEQCKNTADCFVYSDVYFEKSCAVTENSAKISEKISGKVLTFP